jgi:hypothetical protein
MTATSGSLAPERSARIRSAGAILFDILMLAFVALIVVTALGIRPGARLVPLSIGLPTIGLLLLQLALDVRGRAPAHRAALIDTNLSSASIGEVIEAARVEEADEVHREGPEDMRREALFAAWTVAYVILGFATNFLVATPIAVGAILLITRVQPVLALILAGATGLGVWVAFDLFLQVRF